MRRFNYWAVLGAAGASAYAASKVHLAVHDRLGMPGFPAPAESYAGIADVTTAQLGNAAVGMAAVALTLLLLRPMRRGPLRVLLHVASWAGVAMPTAGVVGFGIRALHLTDALGAPPPTPATAWLSLAVGALWAAGWTLAILNHPRRALARRGTAQRALAAR